MKIYINYEVVLFKKKLTLGHDFWKNRDYKNVSSYKRDFNFTFLKKKKASKSDIIDKSVS